tara:strand:- start:42 stop:485 length:444 start_codon:yes stop_codon:yes gene_type:complete
MRIKKNGKVINLTESDLKRIVKKVLTEGEKDCITNLPKEGYSDVTSDFFKPDGVIFLPDGEYENMNTHRGDFAVVMGKDGQPTGYAVCVEGADGYRSNPVRSIKISLNGGGIQLGSGTQGVKISKIYLNDKLLKKSGLSTIKKINKK